MEDLRQKLHIELAAPAIIMAYGIFFLGAFEFFPHLEKYDTFLVSVFALCTIGMYVTLFWVYGDLDKWQTLLSQPVRLFALGTWIASISVFSIVLNIYIDIYVPLLQWITIGNVLLLVCFFALYVRSFILLWTSHRREKVDGIVLLSTVSVQAAVLMLYDMFGGALSSIYSWMIMIGIACYLIGLSMVIRSYTKKTWKLVDHWANTNCIIHGALSITGLAMVMTEAFPSQVILLTWGITIFMLFTIELVECIRAWKRYKQYGLRHGLFSYHVTQWSRNFTFGMFFAFTYRMEEKGMFIPYEWGRFISNYFLQAWAIVVLSFLIVQTILFFYGKTILYVKGKSM